MYVKVASEQYFSGCLRKVLTPEHQRQCMSGARVRVPGGCNFCSIPSNCITWCKTELVRPGRREDESLHRVSVAPVTPLLSLSPSAV